MDKIKNFFGGSSIKKSSSPTTQSPSNICCNLCKDDINQSAFIILSCNHIFHITCLADIFFEDIYNHDILNEEYFENINCSTCNCKLEVEEIMFLHSKFISNTKILIRNHETSIDNLENQLKQIKNELRTCYDYKHKLEKQREKFLLPKVSGSFYRKLQNRIEIHCAIFGLQTNRWRKVDRGKLAIVKELEIR